MDTGVYMILNRKNWKRYVGSTVRGFKHRWSRHLASLRHGKGSSHLQHAWNKYGPDAFTFIVIERCSRERCIEREQHWIDTYPKELLYNLSPTAGSSLGVKMPAEVVERLSAAHRGKKLTEEHKANIRASCAKGFNHTDEAKAKISKAHKGRKLPEWQKRHLSQLNTGNKHTEEAKRKIQAASLARREEISKEQKALWADPEYRARVLTIRREAYLRRKKEALECLFR